jgi:tRNA A37 methylthiotransferase MiaB
MKYSVITFGCRVNQADSLGFEEELRAAGAVAVSPDRADLVMVNTCSVTATADQGARQTIRRIARDNPGARIVVTGCYATRRPDEVGALPNVVQVISNDDKPRLIQILRRDMLTSAPTTTAERFGDGEGSCGAAIEPGVAGRTAFTLRVQTGCAEPCSYCIIPATRGAPRSVPPEAVLAEVEHVTAAGFKEIALTGVHLGSYGRDLSPRSSLLELLRNLDRARVGREPVRSVRLQPDRRPTPSVRRVRLPPSRDASAFAEASAFANASADRRSFSGGWSADRRSLGVGWSADRSPDVLFRISSLEPMDCTRDIVDLVAASPRFAPHFHLPLQHASNRVLARMRRPYTVEQYAVLVDDIRDRIPSASIGSDVIVGFPGESDDDFEQLASYLEGSPLTHVHVFPYSDRPGTAASAMGDRAPGAAVRERARWIREIGQRLTARFRESQIGTVHRGLTLEDGSLVVTGNYLKVKIPPGRRRNEWVDVKIVAARDAMIGEPVQ